MSSAAEVTDNMWETTVLKSETPVLVDFWAEWCGPCKAMSPYVDKLAQELGARLKVVKLNIQENQQVPSSYGIISIPTFLLIKDGEVVHKIVGAKADFSAFKAEIEKHL